MPPQGLDVVSKFVPEGNMPTQGFKVSSDSVDAFVMEHKDRSMGAPENFQEVVALGPLKAGVAPLYSVEKLEQHAKNTVTPQVILDGSAAAKVMTAADMGYKPEKAHGWNK